jgi:hypothetical protein
VEHEAQLLFEQEGPVEAGIGPSAVSH